MYLPMGLVPSTNKEYSKRLGGAEEGKFAEGVGTSEDEAAGAWGGEGEVVDD